MKCLDKCCAVKYLCSAGVDFCPIVVNEGFVSGLGPDFQSFNLLGIFFWQNRMFCYV